MPLAVQTRTVHRTKQEMVYRTLREAIMTCELQPGERLVIDELARRLEVSAIPVREALQQLQSEGLVVTVPHTGAAVAPILQESILDTFTVLEGLQGVAIRLVAERASPEDLEKVALLVSAMDEAAAGGLFAEWGELNKRFHLTIGELPGLALLREMTARALDRWDRVRRYYFRGVLSHRVHQAQKEHREILAALRRRDVQALQELTCQHNRGALADYLHYLGDAPRDEEPGA